jgi:hypothetical protein
MNYLCAVCPINYVSTRDEKWCVQQSDIEPYQFVHSVFSKHIKGFKCLNGSKWSGPPGEYHIIKPFPNGYTLIQTTCKRDDITVGGECIKFQVEYVDGLEVPYRSHNEVESILLLTNKEVSIRVSHIVHEVQGEYHPFHHVPIVTDIIDFYAYLKEMFASDVVNLPLLTSVVEAYEDYCYRTRNGKLNTLSTLCDAFNKLVEAPYTNKIKSNILIEYVSKGETYIIQFKDDIEIKELESVKVSVNKDYYTFKALLIRYNMIMNIHKPIVPTPGYPFAYLYDLTHADPRVEVMDYPLNVFHRHFGKVDGGDKYEPVNRVAFVNVK